LTETGLAVNRHSHARLTELHPYLRVIAVQTYNNIRGYDMKPFSAIPNPRDIRKRLRMNQSEFWSRIGVTQSGGSRYESGRSLPKPVRELVRLVYLRNVPLDIANGIDLRVAAQLKRKKPDLYRELRKSADKH